MRCEIGREYPRDINESKRSTRVVEDVDFMLGGFLIEAWGAMPLSKAKFNLLNSPLNSDATIFQ